MLQLNDARVTEEEYKFLEEQLDLFGKLVWVRQIIHFSIQINIVIRSLLYSDKKTLEFGRRKLFIFV